MQHRPCQTRSLRLALRVRLPLRTGGGRRQRQVRLSLRHVLGCLGHVLHVLHVLRYVRLPRSAGLLERLLVARIRPRSTRVCLA